MEKKKTENDGYLKYRWVIMLLISVALFGSYLAYDSMGPIAPMLKKDLGFSGNDIGLLYGIYSLPNIIMVFLGGIVFDRIGSRKACILFAGVMFLGTLITALAPGFSFEIPLLSSLVPNKVLLMMLIGRFLFGIGSESLIIAQSAIIARWFGTKEMALAFGLNLTVSRLGTVAAFFSFGYIAERAMSIHPVLWAACIFCLVSVISALVYAFSESAVYRKYGVTAYDEAQDKVTLSQIRNFLPGFWYISVLCFLFYSCVFPFTAFATDFFHIKWGLSQDMASKIAGIHMVFSMILTPVFGLAVDKKGRRASMMALGTFLLIPVFLLLAFTGLTPWIAMSVLGLAFSLFPAAMWPSVPLVADEKILGTAYGLISLIQNTGLFLFPLIIGNIYDRAGSYTPAIVFLAICGALCFALSLLLKKSSPALEAPRK